MKRMLTFDDVALVPGLSSIESRKDPFLGTNLSKNIRLATPIVASPMDCVIGDELADILLDNGSKPMFHRFVEEEQIKTWLSKYGENCIISWGVNELDNLRQLLLESKQPPAGICIDVAHGHSRKVLLAIEYIKERFPGIDVVAGAVCTAEAVRDLANSGADSIRIGQGCGSACSTRMVTGFGVPQFSALQECAAAADDFNIPIICDGGIRDTRDCILALAAGADTIMIGKLFAACKESAAQKAYREGMVFHQIFGTEEKELYARYYGQASKVHQKEDRAIEGEEAWIPVTGRASELIHKFELAIKSAMAYAGANNIQELQAKAKFVEVTTTYLIESNIRL